MVADSGTRMPSPRSNARLSNAASIACRDTAVTEM